MMGERSVSTVLWLLDILESTLSVHIFKERVKCKPFKDLEGADKHLYSGTEPL
jgi:hypothetical protein